MIVYICSPYGGKEDNVVKARQLIKYAIDQGHAPIAPHVMYHGILDDKEPLQRYTGLARAIDILRVCDEIWIPGWCEPTEGMAREIELSGDLRKPLRVIDQNDLLRFLARTERRSI